MANITEYIVKLQKLTQQNLDILQAINDSFFTKQDHLSIAVGDKRYAMPSFISLENKLNYVIAAVDALTRAPESGEAFFNFDGNSRAIQVRSYEEAPNCLKLPEVAEFEADQIDIFKDFLTPTPYIKLTIPEIPNDITEVLIKKIVPINEKLKDRFKAEVGGESTKQFPYKDLYKILSIYKENEDYIEYDSKISLPIRKHIGSGVYVVDKIVEDYIDDNLDNILVLKLRDDLDSNQYMNSLKYRLFDETIDKPLKEGDELVTFEGNAKLVIKKVSANTNTITVKVMHGEYVNLVGIDKETNPNPEKISSLSKLKFYSPIDFDEDKYIKVPLEEDPYIYVAAAPLNSRMNVQASWGEGLFVNTDGLVMSNGTSFSSYYKSNVKNIGDALHELTSILSKSINSLDKNEYNSLISKTPGLSKDDLKVVRINSHLDDSKSVKEIRSLYSRKKQLQSQSTELAQEITTLQAKLAEVSFNDVTGVRTNYEQQISSLRKDQNDLFNSILRTTNEISISANNSEVPLENGKYRIRGFYKMGEEESQYLRAIKVQYRYKNIEKDQNKALTMQNGFLFSDWNDMYCKVRTKTVSLGDSSYKVEFERDNSLENEPSFNQIDIPISQGESVDIRLKEVYDYGYPFVEMTSQWSPTITIDFPEEYLKDVKILDIIEENNKEIEKNVVDNKLKESGVTPHIEDSITDQDITYWHKPENIASGFYTEERRIIPLKDKLSTMSNDLTVLKDEVFGTHANELKISLKHGDTIYNLNPYQIKDVYVEGYGNLDSNNQHIGLYSIKNKVATTVFNISIYNDSNHSAKLFSMFPGGRTIPIQKLTHYKFNKSDYQQVLKDGDVVAVYFEHNKYIEQCSHNEGLESTEVSAQSANQFIYFRLNDPNTGQKYYDGGYGVAVNDYNQGTINGYKWDYEKGNGNTGVPGSKIAYIYPKLSDRFGMSLDSDSIGSYILIEPKQEILIPIVFEYYLKSTDKPISKIMAFDILPSLYKDPVPYLFRINAKYSTDAMDAVASSNQKSNNIKYNTSYN